MCSLVIASGTKLLKQTASCHPHRKGESTGKKLFQKKESNKGQLRDSSKKQKHEVFHGGQSLCSTSKDKGKSEVLQTQKLKRQRRHKKKRTPLVLDETSQLQRRARYLLIKLKLEQNLIDAYSREGWKGQSREKIRPERELQRAKKQILKSKLGLRDIIQQLDLLGSVGQIDRSLMAPDGSIHHEHIFCKKCTSQEVSEDNDIILCDGTCNCAFHQKCHDPPLATEDIPPEGEGWFCKYCDCKMEILETINAHLGTLFSADSTWQDIFREEALFSENGTSDFNPEEEWPDDESDDNDYNPDGDGSDCTGRSSTEYRDYNEDSSSSSLCCSLESEVFSESEFSAERNKISCNLFQLHSNCAMDANDHEIINGPRQRAAVDYKQLYDEMFGKETTAGESFSEDEDWGPPRKRQRGKESDAATTLMTLCEREVKQSSFVEVEKNHLPNSTARKQLSRIPSDAVKKLRESFAENELPSRATKKKISELVGLEYEKVDKWFKNARYMALKTRKAKRDSHSCAFDKSESEADKSSEVNISKGSSLCISAHKKNWLKRVTWERTMKTLLSPLKKQLAKKKSPANAKANVELNDDVSLKKHLLRLKAKMRQKRQVRLDNEQLQAQSAEMQIEQLLRLEAKLQKLKQILSTVQEPKADESNEPPSSKYVVYVPVAELKEKYDFCPNTSSYDCQN